MQRVLPDQTAARVGILAAALEETVAELRLIEAGDLISYIKTNQWGNIADLVQSSSELSFKEGTLSFACTADFDVSWSQSPRVSLDMELQTKAVSAFFTIFLDRQDSMVELRNVWFATMPHDEAAATKAFADAIAEARLEKTASALKSA